MSSCWPSRFSFNLILFLFFIISSSALSPSISRRAFSFTSLSSLTYLASPARTLALDMDAFANSELKSDTPKKGLSEDEALCRFGGASSLRAEACSRVKLKPKSGLDPSGKIDRGDFERCKKDYVMKDGKWSPSWSCTSS
ncbi:hypothetical protein TrRE_jg4909 [Triparma retinervis]|uniref:Uncharacterized protein n=1 Tax=Triparma retinervis TaxID=2557542 RepID=A0A9W6Z6V0_9STRA|nr:hypothetical protein TrRE_jg4909 [Triparma retinervis]